MFKLINMLTTLLFLTVLPLASCSSQSQPIDESKKIVFGTTIGDFGDMVKDSIKPQLEKKGYKVELREYSDYVLINKSLAEKSIDINIFQHRPYFRYSIEQQNLDLSSTFEVPTAGLGLYAGKLSDLDTKQQEISIGIPNDPTNLARSLLLLEGIGYLTLDPNANHHKLVTIKDIKQFNRPVKLVEIDAAQLPRSRDDLDFTIINGNYAISSGVDLTTALAKETGKEYINIAAIRSEDKNAQWVKDVEEAYNSDEFKAYARERFKGYNFPEGW